jgi:DNA-binding beta-propeller fold protein YncE
VVGAGAIQPKENPDTHSLYVTGQLANSVTIIDTNVCNQSHLDACGQIWPSFAVGNAPRFIGLNRATKTLYVVNQGDNSVSVINGATCNSSTTSGCTGFATTPVGNTAQQVVVDETTNTIYVENQGDNTVSVIDGTHCNASDSSGCNQTWPVAPVGAGPQGLGFNLNDHTIYVANTDDKTVSVIDTTHCNGADSSGCTPLATFPVGSGPRAVGVVFDTNTVFVGNRDDLSVSVIDGSTCNAEDISGCPQTAPPAVVVGSYPASGGNNFNILGRSLKVDQQSHRVFVPMPSDSDVVVLDGNVCRADNFNQCVPKVVPRRMGGFTLVAEIDETSGTVYVTNNTDGTVSVFPEP